MFRSTGNVYTFGNAPYSGNYSSIGVNWAQDIEGAIPLYQYPGFGYCMAEANGWVHCFGVDTSQCGLCGTKLNQPVSGIATPDDTGFWMVARDGGVFNINESFYGSEGGQHLNAPMVGIASPDTGGYWLVGADGGIFNFGNAGFYGSLGNVKLSAPIVGMAPTADGRGYWLVGADGGVFNFGDATFYGSLGNVTLNARIVGVSASSDGKGYYLLGADGGVFTFGDATYSGGKYGAVPDEPIGTGVYGAYGNTTYVNTAYNDNWPIIADAGASGTQTSPYTFVLGSTPDKNVISTLSGKGRVETWMSYWTVGAPTGANLYNVGYAAGQYAASYISTTLGTSYASRPAFVVLDAEGPGFSQACGPCSTAGWDSLVAGWTAGVSSGDEDLTAAFYADQSSYAAYGLSSLDVPSFGAVNFPSNPSSSGGNIHGYAAFYASSCPVTANLNQVAGWGGTFNTIQWMDSAVDCAP